MQVSIQLNVTPPRWLQTKTRRKAAALAVAAVLLIPASAFAIHDFTDVPNSSSFHTNISRVYGARITTGCTPTTYCPTQAVTREQMAAFLARASGRTVYDDFGLPDITGTETAIGSVTIRAGDPLGGYANILVHVDLTAFGYDAPSDANVRVSLMHGGGLVQSSWVQVPPRGPANYGIASTSISAVVAVPTGVNQVFSVRVFKEAGTTLTQGLGTLTASYFPFSGLGQNPAVAAPPPAPEPGGVGPSAP